MITVEDAPGLVIAHATLVLEREVVENGAVLVRDGRIAAVAAAETLARDGLPLLDAGGAYLLPGLIDTHNDGLEREINPRPQVGFPGPFALANFERRSTAGGVTTTFHAIYFGDVVRHGRTVGHASECSATILAGAGGSRHDHQVLHRCDVWSPSGLDPLLESLHRFPAPALSLNDHTPGQGQFRDVAAMKRTMGLNRPGASEADLEAELRRRVAERKEDSTTVPGVLRRVHAARGAAPFLIASHDDDSPEKVDLMIDVGASVAEFPVTLPAARRARERGMWITVGAPNIVRGGSTSGNMSATELAAAGLADIICADYHAPSLLYAAFKLVEAGVCPLPAAVAMLTATPARAFGLVDRGVIAPGIRADLCLVTLGAAGPEVGLVLSVGEVAYARGLPAPLPPVAVPAAGVAVPAGAGGTGRGATAVEVTAGSHG
jgi:alpha-D-ribose 1-methylphosphonate 5-triphosphate diphosphatase